MSIGFTLLVPTWISAFGLAALVLAVQLQVRVVEEPHLLRVHGTTYVRYAQQVGRFLSALGRWSSAAPPGV